MHGGIGRGCAETMVFWERPSTEADEPEVFWDCAEIWRAAQKVVFSRTLETVFSARTRIEHEFDPDAGQAMAAGLVDECHLFVCPILVGGGKRALPGGVRAQLELLDERRFDSGVVHLHYRVRH